MSTKPFPKWAKVVISIVGSLFLLLVIIVIATDSPEAAAERNAQQEHIAKAEHRVIPGLNPVDIYVNLKQRGFTVKDSYNPGYSIHDCEQAWPSVTFVASVGGPGSRAVDDIRATVMADGVQKTALAGRDFLALIASVPYTGANPDMAHQWVVDNFNRDSAIITIGGAVFVLKAPNPVFRLLSIRPAE